MSAFTYTAMDQKGGRKTGIVDARNQQAAVSLLKEQGYFVLTLNKKNDSMLESIMTFRGVPFGEVVAFTRQLSTMISAGLSISKALNVLADQTTNLKFKKLLTDILRDVEGGASLANAFGKYPDVFPATYQSLVSAGEASGKLDEILARLADTMESQRELRAKFKSAMIYPTIIFLAMIGVFFMLMLFVVPKLADMYESLNVELPATTQLMISLSDFFVNNVLLVIGGGILFIFGMRYFLQTDGGKNIVTLLAFKTPIFGNLNHKRELTEFTRTLSLLLSSAVPIVDALHIVANVVQSIEFKKGCLDAAKSIEKGGTLSVYLKSNDAFPPILGNMVSTGEETGRLDEVLDRLADFFEKEASHAVEGLSAALEPIILIMLGGMVGFLIISIITPIYKITSAI